MALGEGCRNLRKGNFANEGGYEIFAAVDMSLNVDKPQKDKARDHGPVLCRYFPQPVTAEN